jgi:hypothetical protein
MREDYIMGYAELDTPRNGYPEVEKAPQRLECQG